MQNSNAKSENLFILFSRSTGGAPHEHNYPSKARAALVNSLCSQGARVGALQKPLALLKLPLFNIVMYTRALWQENNKKVLIRKQKH